MTRQPTRMPPKIRHRGRDDRGIAMIAAIVGIILIGSAVAGIYMLARQAELSAVPRSQQNQLQAFAADSVRMCARILGVLAGQDPDGILDIDTLAQAVNSDPNSGLVIQLEPNIDMSRSPIPATGVEGDNALEQEFSAALQASDPFAQNTGWLMDRGSGMNAYRPNVVLRRGNLQAHLDLDPVGGTAGDGGCNAVIEWGGPDPTVECDRGEGSATPEAEQAGNPVAKRMQGDFLFRCRVDARDLSRGNNLIVDAIIRR